DLVRMGLKPVADGGANEVGAVRIKAFPHQQIDVAKIHVTEVDRNLFRVAGSVGEPMDIGSHSALHLHGWYMDGLRNFTRVFAAGRGARDDGGPPRPNVRFGSKADLRATGSEVPQRPEGGDALP